MRLLQKPTALLIAGCSMTLSSALLAADPISPGTVQDTLRLPPPALQPDAPSAALSVPSPAKPSPASQRTITITQFEFAGNTIFDNQRLAAVTADYLNKPISLADLFVAADKVSELYAREGYSLATATIPAQKVTDGRVRMDILEGYIQKIGFTGLKSYREADLASNFAQIPGSIYRGGPFEKSLRTINRLPGLEVKALLRPGEQYGSTQIVIEAEEDRFEGFAFADNSGRKTLGEYRTAAQLTWNNPGGAGDKLSVLGLRSTNDQLQYLSGDYSVPLSDSGARLNLNYSYAQFALDTDLGPFSGKNRSSKAELQFLLLQRPGTQWTAATAVSNTTANTNLDTGTPIRKSNLTLLELSSQYLHTGARQAVTQVTAVASSNFKKFSTNDRDKQRIKFDLELQNQQPLPWTLQLISRGQFVYSPDGLADTQQFSLGGPTSVRGYAPSEVRGDWGYFGSLTLRRPIEWQRAVLAPRIFIDAGRVRSHQPESNDASLSSAGAGLDFSYRSLTAKLDYAIPLDGRDVSDDRDNGRIYSTLAIGF